MLETIKKSIVNLPSKDFGQFYQEYIADLEDSILDASIKEVSKEYNSIDDIPQLIVGINKISQELKL